MSGFASFNLNKPQARFLTVLANESWLTWSRGTGKTVGATAPWVLHKVEALPRSSGAIIVQTFKDGETKILKPLFEAFGKMGHVLDVHFTYKKEPPKHWARPLTPIIDWSNVIAFPNGTVVQMISLHLAGSANSNSFQWIFGPEAKYFNEKQLQTEVFPTLRGHKEVFGGSPWYMAKLFETDKYSSNIHWILDKKKLHDENAVRAVIRYQLEYNELRGRMATADERTAYRIKEKLKRLSIVLAQLRKRMVYYSNASAYENPNLPDNYIEDQKRLLTDYQFRVQIENEDPTRAENGFYPEKQGHHLHTKQDDDDVTRPLAVALDWQASITPLVSCQVNDKVIPGVQSLNFLHSFFVKGDQGIPHVIRDFCNFHQHRLCKKVILYYDHTAIAKRQAARSYYMEAKAQFEKYGWQVHLMYLGAAPYHEVKYNILNKILRGEGRLPVRINMKGCESLLLSMDLTEVKAGSTYEKDKSKERDKDFPQELATHFSDVFDVLAYGIIELNKYPMISGADSSFIAFR